MTSPQRAPFRFSVFLHFIRALFPKWSFFEQVGAKFDVYVKASDSLPWEKLSFAEADYRPSVFFNARMNLNLAQQNIVEHFVTDLQELQKSTPRPHAQEIEAIASFRLLGSWIETKLDQAVNPPITYKFKVVAETPDDTSDVFISHWLYRKSP